MTVSYRQTSVQNERVNLYPQCDIKKTIKKIEKESNHFKRQNSSVPIAAQQERQISKISIQALFLGDLKTNMIPEDLISIINSFPGLNIQEVSPYKYMAEYVFDNEEFEYNEETDDFDSVISQMSIQFSFEIKQLIEEPERFTVLFQNLSKNYTMEFMRIRQQIISKIISH